MGTNEAMYVSLSWQILPERWGAFQFHKWLASRSGDQCKAMVVKSSYKSGSVDVIVCLLRDKIGHNSIRVWVSQSTCIKLVSNLTLLVSNVDIIIVQRRLVYPFVNIWSPKKNKSGLSGFRWGQHGRNVTKGSVRFYWAINIGFIFSRVFCSVS